MNFQPLEFPTKDNDRPGVARPIEADSDPVAHELDLLLRYRRRPSDDWQLRVVIYDPDELSRAGLCALLEKSDSCLVVSQVATRQETVEALFETEPDLLLVREDFSDLLTDKEAEVFAQACPDAAITLVSAQVHYRRIKTLRDAGVSGLIFKSDSSATLVNCLHSTASGRSYISQLVDQQIEAAGELTRREQEIVALLAVGYTTGEIAERLVISAKTVESHRAHINSKLGIKSRAALFAYARSHCLV